MPKRTHPTHDSSIILMKTLRRNSNEWAREAEAEDGAWTKTRSDKSSAVEKGWCSKTISICTMCGRYRGIRMRRYVCIMSFTAIALLTLLTGVLVVFYAIVPAIVRSTIDQAEIGFRSVSIDEIQQDRFRLQTELELSRTGSIPAKILAPLVINVDNIGTVRNEKVIEITGDADKSTIVPVDSPFIVSDQQGFQAFARALIFDEEVTWHLTAKASVQPISRHMPVYSNIPLDKKVKLIALNQLQRVNIRSLSLLRSDAKHIYVDLTIEIVNPSLFTIELGELNFLLRSDNQLIGDVRSATNETTLHPGSNMIAFTGELQAASSSPAYVTLSKVVQNFLTNQTSRVEAVAGPRATSYALLAPSMENLALSVEMPAYDGKLITSLTFNSMSLVPSVAEKTVLLSASITIVINSPLGEQSPLDIQWLDMTASLMYQGAPVGTLQISQATVEQLNATSYRAEFNETDLILSDTGETYEKFAQTFVIANEENPIAFSIAGLASISGSFALGPLQVNGIAVDNDVSLEGLSGLGDVCVHGISIDGEEENSLILTIDVTIGNPGLTDLELRNFTLQLADSASGTLLGRVLVDVLALQPGDNTMTLHGLLTSTREEDLPIFGRFFSAYLNNETQPVQLFHNKTNPDNATAVDLTVSELSIQADLPGIETVLIRQVEVLAFGIEFDRQSSDKVYVSGRLAVLFELPSNVNMSFTALMTSIEYTMGFVDGPKLGRMSLRDLPVQHNQITNELVMSFEREELNVLDQNTFQEFAAQLVLTTNVSVAIDGLALAFAAIRIGNLTFTDLPVHDTLHLTGYNRFDNGLLEINDVDITGALSSESLALNVLTQIKNPSTVHIFYGGRLTLDLRDLNSNLSLGSVIIDPFVLNPQNNLTVLNAQGIFQITRENDIVARQFISAMVSGQNNNVELRGRLNDSSIGTSISLLSSAIGDLHIQASVPGLSDDKALVRQLQIKKLSALQIGGIPLGLVKVLSTRIRLRNPFNTTLTITGMSIRADFGAQVNNDQQVGTVDDKTIININPYQDMLTPYIDVKITAKLTTMVSLAGPLVGGSFGLTLSGFINVTIGNQVALNQIALTLLNITTAQETSV